MFSKMHKFMTMKLKFDEKQFEIDFFVNFTWHKSYEIVNIDLLCSFLLAKLCTRKLTKQAMISLQGMAGF